MSGNARVKTRFFKKSSTCESLGKRELGNNTGDIANFQLVNRKRGLVESDGHSAAEQATLELASFELVCDF